MLDVNSRTAATVGGHLLESLEQHPRLCDGAMTTQLMAAGLAGGECGALWNIDKPQTVEAVHRRYRDAGCELLTTNTFGASPLALEHYGLESRMSEINKAAARLARRALDGGDGWVLGSIGPTGRWIKPIGNLNPSAVYNSILAQAEALHRGGADAILLESMSDPSELAIAIKAARRVDSEWPILATYSFALFDNDFRTSLGSDVRTAVNAAIDAGADIVGAACGGSSLHLPDYTRLAVEIRHAAKTTPVIIRPNAGCPSDDHGRPHYNATPQDLANVTSFLLSLGVQIIGGCCGTTPDHLAAMASEMRRRFRLEHEAL
jgi:5-methyltetrahydrofolate--homocysteine methyltransferase